MSNPIVKMKIQNGGEMRIELFPEIAPLTVENFIELVKDNFYDGLIFHRIIKGFMIQGGDPKGTGLGGSGKHIKGEFSSNGVPNNLSHKRGVISMARASDPNSASSQFFIVDEDSQFLDGNYAAFGMVIDGLDVVSQIANVKTDTRDKPISPVVIESIVLE